MKVTASNQFVILASQHRDANTKAGSVFDAALGPAATRIVPKPLTIVIASSDAHLHDAEDDSLDGAAGSRPLTVEPVSRRATIVSASSRRPVELYAQTQLNMSAKSTRSVFLDVHA